MKLSISSPNKSLKKAYLRQSLKREQIEVLRENLVTMFGRIKPGESEEHLKNIIADFLKDTWYKQTNEINTSGRADLVIHNGRSSRDPVGVIIEVKRPDNSSEMISPEKPNSKALHELLLYYLTERYLNDNKEIKHLIICNIYEWYIFDATDFERFFFDNPRLVKGFKEWKGGLFGIDKTEWFYREIARPFIEKELTELSCTCFDLREFSKIARKPEGGEDRKLIALYKLLSPPHLLKLPFANDSNTLNREFYNELLHIIGLEEVKEKGKKLIRRKPIGTRDDGSLLENTINILMVRNKVPPPSQGEEAFDVALELCITWLNRILFLKLLEGQLRAYHRGNREYAFLDIRRIADFDELEELYFEVLARRNGDRTGSVKEKFGDIPYLNSALFDESDLELETIHVAALKGRLDLEVYGSTVLKDGSGKRLTGKLNTLRYLFEFLDSYDFSSEGEAEIQETPRTIINASVLGLIFEKINGYRDGSFYTPGYITMYICRETIRRAVVERFNTHFPPRPQGEGRGEGGVAGRSFKDFDDLRDRLDCSDREMRKRANSVVNSVTVCDPAVGSGHFLVSALNELIAIKSELGILSYRDNGDRIKEYRIGIENDELIITDKETDGLFAYTLNRNNRPIDELQRLQETLFHEKQDIIENCLFGVDINPKSVAICRLRLWIELLKNAYYTKESGYTELETLPNIDINIKCGNSLVSRFAIYGNPNILPGDRKKLKELTEKYRRHVFEYKLSPANKAQLRKVIDNLKEDLQNFALPNDKDLTELRKKENSLAQLPLFALGKKETAERQKLQDDVERLERRYEEKQKSVYSNAFEWRFEFPEVLDENGEFTGFDVVIGNPPYVRQEAIKEQKGTFADQFGNFFCGTADLYTYFYKVGLDIARPGAFLCYIAPNKFMRAGYGRNTRELLTSQAKPLMVLDFGDLPVFEEATTYPSIVMVEKAPPPAPSSSRRGSKPSPPDSGGVGGDQFLAATFTEPEELTSFADSLPNTGFIMPVSALKSEGWTLERPEVLSLMEKLRKVDKPLGEYVEGKFYYGIKTGLNEAFVIDEDTRQRLITEDPRSAEVIKPWLRGRDIPKWKAEWAGLYLITLASSANMEWPWSRQSEEAAANAIFRREYPAIHRHLAQWEEALRKRDDQGRFWWELRACVYWKEFEKPKISWSHFATVPEFVYDKSGFLSNDKSYIMPTDDLTVLGILNAKITSFFIGQISPPVRGGFMELRKIYLEQFPIPAATEAQKAAIIECVEKILAANSAGANGVRPHVATGPEAGACHAPLHDQPIADIPALEAEIDRLVYALYGLTDEEIALVEGKA